MTPSRVGPTRTSIPTNRGLQLLTPLQGTHSWQHADLRFRSVCDSTLRTDSRPGPLRERRRCGPRNASKATAASVSGVLRRIERLRPAHSEADTAARELRPCDAAPDVVIVVADEVTDQDQHRAQFEAYRTAGAPGYRSSRLTRISAPINFASSQNVDGLQVADLAAYLHRGRSPIRERLPVARAARERMVTETTEAPLRGAPGWRLSGNRPVVTPIVARRTAVRYPDVPCAPVLVVRWRAGLVRRGRPFGCQPGRTSPESLVEAV